MPRDQAVEAFEKALPIWRDVIFPHSVEGLADLLGLDAEDDEGELMVAYHFQLAWEQLGLLQKAPWPIFVPTPRALQELQIHPAEEAGD